MAETIFMNCANADGFAARHTVQYGHNVKNGSMFGGLHQYPNTDFLVKNPTNTVTLPDGTTQTYTIFAAVRAVDISEIRPDSPIMDDIILRGLVIYERQKQNTA